MKQSETLVTQTPSAEKGNLVTKPLKYLKKAFKNAKSLAKSPSVEATAPLSVTPEKEVTLDTIKEQPKHSSKASQQSLQEGV